MKRRGALSVCALSMVFSTGALLVSTLTPAMIHERTRVNDELIRRQIEADVQLAGAIDRLTEVLKK